MNKKWLTVVFGSALFLAACGGDGEKTGETVEQSEGEKVVMQYCATCHGGNLQGMSSAPALNDVGSRLSQDEILDIILNGTNKGMPGGLIKGDEADKAAEWLATQK